MDVIKEKLLDNLKGVEGTLIYQLHENNEIDIDNMNEFYEMSKSIIKGIVDETVDPKTVAVLYSNYTLIWKYFAFHFDKKDSYFITNLTSDLYGEIADELEYIFDIKKVGLVG